MLMIALIGGRGGKNKTDNPTDSSNELNANKENKLNRFAEEATAVQTWGNSLWPAEISYLLV